MSKQVISTKVKALSAFAIASSVFLGVSAVTVASSSPNDTLPVNPTSLVSAGENSSLISSTSGAAYGRGENETGVLGNGSYDNENTWSQVSGDSYTKISSPYDHAIALKSDETIVTWGGNRYNAMSTGTSNSITTPKQITASPVYTDLSSGPNFVLAIDKAGHLFAWGANESGQLGTGNTEPSAKPVMLAAGTTFQDVKAGKNYSLALDSANRIWAWGANESGQLGTGNTEPLSQPTMISEQTFKFISTSASSETTIAIDTNGGLYTWGNNSSGQIGNGSDWRQAQRDENARVEREIAAIKAADAAKRQALINTCTVNRQTELDKWQREQDVAQAAADREFARKAAEEAAANPTPTPTPNPSVTPAPTPTPTATPTPTPTAPPIEPTRPKPTWDNTCTQEVDATFKATDTSGIVPAVIPEPALAGNSASPVRIAGNRSFVAAAAGSQNAYAVDSLGKLYAWGSDANGQTGLGITDDKAHTQIPLATSTTGTFNAVEAGDKFAAAVTRTGVLYTWGANEGTGAIASDEAAFNVPTKIRDSVKSVHLGIKTGYILDTANSVYSWGAGANGLLGDAGTANRAAIQPVNQISNLIAVGGNSVMSLDGASELVSWGSNENGTFATSVTSKTIVGPTKNTISKFKDIAAGRYFSLAVDENGTVWAWGYNGLKQTGPYGEDISTGRPVVVPLNVKAKFVIAGQVNSYAVGEDNSVWTWGAQDPNPRNIGTTDSNIVQIAAGNTYLEVLDENGSIWEWGYGKTGTYRYIVHETLTKLEEPETKYKAIAAGGDTTLAITEDGDVVGWGSNDNGQLLLPNGETATGLQTLIDDTRDYEAISVSSTHALAVDSKNAVYGWGTEPYGTFGNQAKVTDKVQVLPIYMNETQENE